jgi:ribose transport system substrate-binding protein
VSAAKGKTVWYLGSTAYNIEVEWWDATKAGLEAAGVTPHFYDVGDTGAPSVTQEGFQLAIAAKAAAIDFTGGDPATFTAQIAQAKAAGIPVISNVNSDGPAEQPTIPGLYVDVSWDFITAGQYLADWVVANSGGKPLDIYTPYTVGTFQEGSVVQGFKQRLKQLDPGVKLTLANVPQSAATATATANQVQTALESDPKINWVVPPFDSSAIYAQQGVDAAHDQNTVKVTAFNAVVPELQTLQAGTPPLVSDLGASNELLGYVQADATLRAILKLPRITNYHIGFKFFEHQNLKGINITTAASKQLYGYNIPAVYAKTWADK